jgi:hypothetical protein
VWTRRYYPPHPTGTKAHESWRRSTSRQPTSWVLFTETCYSSVCIIELHKIVVAVAGAKVLNSVHSRVGTLSSMFPGINTLIDKISDRQNKASRSLNWTVNSHVSEHRLCHSVLSCQERVVLSITIALHSQAQSALWSLSHESLWEKCFDPIQVQTALFEPDTFWHASFMFLSKGWFLWLKSKWSVMPPEKLRSCCFFTIWYKFLWGKYVGQWT